MSEATSYVLRTIEELVAKIDEKMRPVIPDMRLVNTLCAHANLPPRYPYAEPDAASSGSLSIRRDQFHKKPLATAVREYLEQRGPSDKGGLGAATISEIYDALVAGGYEHEAKDDANAKRALAIALTKNSVTFYRVSKGAPGGAAYGLLTWYPNAKPQDDSKPKAKRGRPPKTKAKKRSGRPPKGTPNNVVEPADEKAAADEAA